MTTSPTKRSVGRPRKNAKKQENPDCEVATKGYVKCLMRKMIKHDNYQYYYNKEGGSQGIPSMLGGILAFFGWASAMITGGEPYAAWGCGIVMAVCVITCLESKCMPSIIADEKEHKAFEKHEEPPCEPRPSARSRI
jgi:hypothetical protein